MVTMAHNEPQSAHRAHLRRPRPGMGIHQPASGVNGRHSFLLLLLSPMSRESYIVFAFFVACSRCDSVVFSASPRLPVRKTRQHHTGQRNISTPRCF